MLHIVEVDQSGKIEDTSKDTILAFANGIKFSLLIPATVKRQCVQVLRDNGLSGQTLYFQLYATGLFFLLRGHIQYLLRVVLDNEYIGQEGQIKQHLYNLLQRTGINIEKEQVHFTSVGKKSPAHILALSIFRGQSSADLTLTAEDLLREFGLAKKVQRVQETRRPKKR